jgi:hypothetical protein
MPPAKRRPIEPRRIAEMNVGSKARCVQQTARLIHWDDPWGITSWTAGTWGRNSGIGPCDAPMRSSTWTANGRLRNPLYRSEVNVPLNRINKCCSARNPDADRHRGQSSLALNIGTLAGEDDPIWSHSSVSVHRLRPVSDKHPSKRDNGQNRPTEATSCERMLNPSISPSAILTLSNVLRSHEHG